MSEIPYPMHLSVQGHTLQKVESLEQLIEILDQMDGEKLSYFLISDDDAGYMQLLGEKNKLTICTGRRGVARVQHTIIGLSKRDESETSIIYSGGEVIVQKNEVLMYEDAVFLLTAFWEHKEIPSAYCLREVKGKFV